MPVPRARKIQEQIMGYGFTVGRQIVTAITHHHLGATWGLTLTERAWLDPAGGFHWHKRIDGAIQQLKKKGLIIHVRRGEWLLTLCPACREGKMQSDARGMLICDGCGLEEYPDELRCITTQTVA